jgi:hypothetical protein
VVPTGGKVKEEGLCWEAVLTTEDDSILSHNQNATIKPEFSVGKLVSSVMGALYSNQTHTLKS